jgi:paraquat-inducible protein A
VSKQSLLLCHDCDLIVRNATIDVSDNVLCPRCGACLFATRPDSVNRVLALSLSGLLLFIPANTLPIMSLQIIGQSNSNTMVNGIVQLAEQGYWWMAFLVMLCSVAVPIIELSILFTLALAIKLKRWWRLSIDLLKWQQKITEWGMLDVYMLGILVAFIKMRDLGDVNIGLGLASFVALLLLTVMTNLSFDQHSFWEQVDANKR